METEYLDDVEIEEELLKIQSLHESFNETNPLTYKLMLITNKDKLNQGQINYLEMMFNKYNTRQQKIYNKWRSYMTRDITEGSSNDIGLIELENSCVSKV